MLDIIAIVVFLVILCLGCFGYCLIRWGYEGADGRW